ncbi:MULTISPECIES: AAA family ATPase [unclassified Streptomyces]|uniref:AAA family ATPase n=1 Tax=unclassified Streptomyces TaxID=2593676 RepID=UPI000370DA42|nr:AAA family ATPase [Streptomyces sp. LaPpAH-202]MYW61343.1 AAA family ATPase [Streptomyces sp. SID8370]MYW87290.1 AAA family ATPase [Streptomyces sp. SID8371]
MTNPEVDMWAEPMPPEHEEVAHLAVAPNPEAPPPTWRPRDLDDVLNGTYQAPQPTVGKRDDGVGMFYPGRMHSIVGESEGGKTWFALLAVAGELAAGNAVVFIDFEDDAPGVVGRLLALGADRAHIRDRFAYIRPEDPLNVGFNRLEIGQALNDLRPTFVPIDGVTEGMAMHGMELKDNTDVAKFGRMLLRPIAELGAAVATLDHVVKDKEGRGRYAIGGVHKLNGLNGAMYVLENRSPFGVGVTGRSTVRIAKDRPGQLRRHALPHSSGLHWFADFELRSHDETFTEARLHTPVEDTGPFRPVVYMKRVADALTTASSPLSVRGVQDRVGGGKELVRTALARLVDEGFVTVQDGPRGSQLHQLAKPFTEGGDRS